MSLAARLLIALFAGLCGVAMFASASEAEPGKHWLFYLFGTFCFAISLACIVKGWLAHFIGGLIAVGIFAAVLGYLGDTLMHGPVTTGRQSDASVVNALLFLIVFGIPATKYLLATRFGFAAPSRAVNEQLSVEFDDVQVRTRVLDGLEDRWNQSFDWLDVVRVCFRDEGLHSTDLLFIEVRGRSHPVIVPTEAAGGSEFFGALTQRGLFPEDVWRRAISETGGATHCWPPHSDLGCRK